MTAFTPYDRIEIINLPHRKDRRREMMAQLRKVGLENDPRVQFFPAISPQETGIFSRRGYLGSFLSHLELLKKAAASGKSILILEDDCDFIVPDALEYRMPEGVDVFYGGYLIASNPDDPADSDIIGAHFMGFSARAAKAAAEYLTAFLEPDFPPDPRAAAMPDYNHAIRPPIDGAYVWFRRAHPELITVFAMLSDQRASRTDIGDQRWFDMVPGLRGLAGVARSAKRKLSGGGSPQ